jgi:hypothetical protein
MLYQINGTSYRLIGAALVKASAVSPGQMSLFDEAAHPRSIDGKFTKKLSVQNRIDLSADAIANRLINIDKINPSEIKSAYNRYGANFPKALLFQYLKDYMGDPSEWDAEDSKPKLEYALGVHAIDQIDCEQLAKKMAHGVDLQALKKSREKRGAKDQSPLPTVDIHQATKDFLADFHVDVDHSIEMGELRRNHGQDFGKAFLKSRIENRGALRGLTTAAIDQLDSDQVNKWLKDRRTASRTKE